jgi:hypothetical protein
MPKKPEIKVLSGEDEFTVSLNGRTLAAGWGPGVDGHWYARVLNNEPVKVADRNEAFAHAMQAIEMVARGEIR